eukprot:CAMPEP_0177629116 /NCGR_PEP_ID=MMETSP0447-20121125/496_1 /TAXON_ID=0 /ORGANISM="Stygamoeba regulata, Strain BSH-02190019" /LENGTH=693 /DNA_ID=CAMNT_0019130415 /DNA_START=206 /DNA_END=2285 /DNA_ORIENTATION=+
MHMPAEPGADFRTKCPYCNSSQTIIFNDDVQLLNCAQCGASLEYRQEQFFQHNFTVEQDETISMNDPSLLPFSDEFLSEGGLVTAFSQVDLDTNSMFPGAYKNFSANMEELERISSDNYQQSNVGGKRPLSRMSSSSSSSSWVIKREPSEGSWINRVIDSTRTQTDTPPGSWIKHQTEDHVSPRSQQQPTWLSELPQLSSADMQAILQDSTALGDLTGLQSPPPPPLHGPQSVNPHDLTPGYGPADLHALQLPMSEGGHAGGVPMGPDHNFLVAYFTISEVGESLGVERVLRDRAMDAYRACSEALQTGDIGADLLAGACLYVELLRGHAPISMADFATAARQPQKELQRVTKMLMHPPSTGLDGPGVPAGGPPPAPAPTHMAGPVITTLGDDGGATSANPVCAKMADFCRQLQLDSKTEFVATHIGTVMFNKNYCSRRNPMSISAAALYLASQLQEDETEICKVTGLTEVTLRKVYKELIAHMDELLPPNYTSVTPPAKIIQVALNARNTQKKAPRKCSESEFTFKNFVQESTATDLKKTSKATALSHGVMLGASRMAGGQGAVVEDEGADIPSSSDTESKDGGVHRGRGRKSVSLLSPNKGAVFQASRSVGGVAEELFRTAPPPILPASAISVPSSPFLHGAHPSFSPVISTSVPPRSISPLRLQEARTHSRMPPSSDLKRRKISPSPSPS